jgi:hypothetical protein
MGTDQDTTRPGAVARVWGSSVVRYLAVGVFCFVVDVQRCR